MKIELERVPDLPPREKWYRLEERENETTNIILPWNYGSFVEYDRYIVRAGYYWQPEDMPLDLLMERSLQHTQNHANMYLGKDRKTKLTLELMGIYPDYELMYDDKSKNVPTGPITREIIESVLWAISTQPEYLLKDLFYRIRGDWLAQQEEYKTRLRTFWYVDTDFGSSQIREHYFKQIGKKQDGWMSGGYYESEYVPPYFAMQSQHRLYHIGWSDGVHQGEKTYVHPHDVKGR